MGIRLGAQCGGVGVRWNVSRGPETFTQTCKHTFMPTQHVHRHQITFQSQPHSTQCARQPFKRSCTANTNPQDRHMEDTRKSCHNYVDGYNSHWEMMRRANVGTLFRRPLAEHMCMYMHIMMQLAKWQHT